MKIRMARPIARLKEGRADWFNIENRDDGPAKVSIYDEIGYFGVTAQDFVDRLSEVKASAIELHINSPGGDVFAGVAIYNALCDHPATVTTIVDGLAASAASFIAMSGDTIRMNRASQMMIHDASGLCIGNADDMRDMVDRLDRVSDTIAGIYAQRAGGTVDEWRERMKTETWYSDKEAVTAKLADESVNQAQKNTNTWDLSIFSFAGRKEAPAPEMEARPPAKTVEPPFFFDADQFRKAFEESN